MPVTRKALTNTFMNDGLIRCVTLGIFSNTPILPLPFFNTVSTYIGLLNKKKRLEEKVLILNESNLNN